MDISFNHTFFLDGKPFRRTTPGSRTFYKACKNDNPYKNYTSYEYEEQHSFFYSVEIIYVTQDSVFLDINNTWYRFINQNNFFTSWGTCFFFVSTPPPHNDDAYKAITFTTTQTFYQENPSDIWYWVANTFAYTFDFITDLSLRAVAYIADRDNLPFKEIYHLYMNKPWIDTAPMILHSHVTEISHIGKNLYNEHHLPVLFTKHARKHQKTYTHDFYTIQHWLRQIIMRRLNIDYNFTSITESLIRRRWLDLYKLFLFAALLYYHVLYRVLIPVFILPIDTSKFYIDDRNFFGVWVSFVAVSFYQYSLLLPHR